MKLRAFALFALVASAAPAWAIKPGTLMANTWEAARTPEGERTYVRFQAGGKAEVVSEYDFQLPGQAGKHRGRATTYGKWSVKGDEVTVRYAQIRDRLQYTEKASLSGLGLEGSAPALKVVGKPAEKSRLQATLWKAPHEYRLKPQPEPASAPAAPEKKEEK